MAAQETTWKDVLDALRVLAGIDDIRNGFMLKIETDEGVYYLQSIGYSTFRLYGDYVDYEFEAETLEQIAKEIYETLKDEKIKRITVI